MPDEAFDDAFARHLRHAGLVTPEQLNQAVAEKTRAGGALTDSLVRLGFLTPAQGEALTRKVRERQEGLRQVGPYKVVKKLGQGGMGAVYLANGPDGAAVAVKVLSREQAAQGDAAHRFRREAEAAVKLRHPHLVRALVSGEDDGLLYYVMEYVEGGTLDVLLSRPEPLALGRVLNIVIQTARGLDYLHRQGFLHRDIKPANILLSRDGVAQVLDLGLTKDLGGGASLQTVTGAVMGTPHYISPEQARGDKSIDARSDLYSLGATLYHLLTNRLPFEGTTALEILSKHIHQRLPDPREFRPEISEHVIHVLRRMMAKEPIHRYADCAALISDLEEVAAGRPPKSDRLEAELSTLAQRRIDVPRRKSRKLPLFAGAGAVALALAVWALSRPAPAAPPVPPPPPPPAPAVVEAKKPAWIELLPMIDFARDIRVGGWTRRGQEIIADGTENAGCQVPYLPPREYDLVVEFTREKRGCETGVFAVWADQTPFLVGLAGYGNTASGIGNVGGKAYGENPTRKNAGLLAGRRYRLEVEVRVELVRALLDGEELTRWTPALGPLGRTSHALAPVGLLLGLSNCETPTVFHRLAILERDGQGKPGR
ncbi:MAG TPA: serine/threonine-protein kinase [Planctomycetota bacterium]